MSALKWQHLKGVTVMRGHGHLGVWFPLHKTLQNSALGAQEGRDGDTNNSSSNKDSNTARH